MTNEEAKKAGFRKAKHKPCDMPDEMTFNGAGYRRLADNEQHKDGDIPVDGSQTHRFGSIWYRPAESHETLLGETQDKEVVTEETQDKEPVKWTTYDESDTLDCNLITPEWRAWKVRQDTKASNKPTTVRGWLETIPDQAIRDAAIRQCEEWSKNCTNLPDSIFNIWNWDLTSEGVEFWNRCYDAAYDGTPWPVYPSKAKQESDGWTQAEIDRAAFKSDAVAHPSHYTSHPSGVECITITKHMNFCRGNAVKYLWRAGQKGDSIDKEIEDIAKAEEYCRIEKERLIAKKGAK